MAESPRCLRCDIAMIRQDELLDLSWAGDGPNREDLEFRGILAEVFRCPTCREIGTRPVTIALPGARTAVA